MPGTNCCIPLCGTNRRHKGVGIFKLPALGDVKSQNWRDELLGEIKKVREVDKAFREQIKNNAVSICELQFKPSCIKHRKYNLQELTNFFPSTN